MQNIIYTTKIMFKSLWSRIFTVLLNDIKGIMSKICGSTSIVKYYISSNMLHGTYCLCKILSSCYNKYPGIIIHAYINQGSHSLIGVKFQYFSVQN